MSIDIFLKEYYAAVKEIEKNETKKIAKTKAYKERVHIVQLMLLALLLTVIGILISFYLGEVFFGLVFFTLMFSVVFLVARWGMKNELKWKIKWGKMNEKDRIGKLQSLFRKYNLHPCDSTIDAMISESKINKDKYNNLKTIQLLSVSAVTFFSSLLALCIKLTSIDLPISLVASLMIYLSMLGLFGVLGKHLLCSVLEPRINKMYLFHDSFIEDLNTLKIFKGLYNS